MMLSAEKSLEVLEQKWQWEFHPLLEMLRPGPSGPVLPERMTVYETTEPTAKGQLWCCHVPLQPIDTWTDRASYPGQSLIQILDNKEGYEMLIRQGWRVDDASVTTVGQREKPSE